MSLHCKTLISDVVTPIQLFAQLRQASEYAFLLESTEGEGDTRLARYSMLGVSPRRVLTFTQGQVTQWQNGQDTSETSPCDDPLHYLSQVPMTSTAGELDWLPFTGGWVGYLGYGATLAFDHIQPQAVDPYQVPDGVWGDYEQVVIFDHLTRRLHIVAPADQLPEWEVTVQRAIALAQTLPPLSLDEQTPVDKEALFEQATGPMDRAAYCQAVNQCHELIRAGEVFQIVLAHRFSVPHTGDPLAVYRYLCAINPSPYAYYLQCPGYSYLGASPETFVRVQQGEVMLKALAGTRPRGATPAEDRALETELKANAKELAEHRMLVDLARNDMGRISRVGTVRVGPIAEVTRYTHVMHLATEVTGQLRSDKTVFDVARSCFPRGTLSGAPKIRAMQHLARLEPERRGIYSGLVGYFDRCGQMNTCIAIRSALLKDGVAHVQAGAGVVYDSIPDDEYEETRNKAASVMKALWLARRGEGSPA